MTHWPASLQVRAFYLSGNCHRLSLYYPMRIFSTAFRHISHFSGVDSHIGQRAARWSYDKIPFDFFKFEG